VEGAEKEVKVEAEGMVEPIILPNKIAFRCGLFLDLIESPTASSPDVIPHFLI